MKREEKTISEITKLKEDIEYLAHSFKVSLNLNIIIFIPLRE